MNGHEIAVCDLKQYVSSIRACRYMPDGSIEMEPNSIVSFDFSSFINIAKCIFKGKRISGNGTIIIGTESSKVNTRFTSVNEHTVPVETLHNKIEIIREAGASGKVLICGITIITNEDSIMTQNTETTIESMNWRSIMTQCEPYKNVRVAQDKLFASEGGSIKSSNIDSIITEPQDAYVNKDGFIKFMIPCEILEIKLSSIDKVHSGSMYRNVEAPPIITTNYDVHSVSSSEPTKYKSANLITNNISTGPSSNMYDSLECGLNVNGFSSVVGTVSNMANGIIMTRQSSFCVPITTIQPNFEYIVVVTARTINGNGKLEVSIVADDNNNVRSSMTLLSQHKKSELFFKLKSGEQSSNYKIKINRGQNSIGDIFVERIKLINGIFARNGFNITASSEYGPVAKIDVCEPNDIEVSSKTFSIFEPDQYASISVFDDIKGIIRPTTYNTLRWISKIFPLFNNLYINSVNFVSPRTVREPAQLVMGSIGRLKAADRIWLEEFQGKLLTDSDVAILRNAKNIFSPSLPNVQFLRKHFPNTNIVLIPKVWPYVAPQNPNINVDDFILTFHRTNQSTANIVSACASLGKKLVIIGARGAFPPNVIPIDIYSSYSQIMWLISNANCIVDVPECNHYMSGILDLAFILGIPIATSNQWMSVAKPSVALITSNELLVGNFIPDINSISDGIVRALAQQKKCLTNMNSYNLNVYSNMKMMLME